MDNELPTSGDIFEDRYHIESLLGSGGFANVYLATQQDLGRQVAIKLIKKMAGEREGDQKALERFYREAQLIGRLRDPHTISLHDFGETDAGLPYMITEYVAGESLDETLRGGERVSAERVVSILRQVLASLEEAHDMGVLHRDIKPANILIYEHLRKRDQVKVLDFGIAKPMGRDDGVTRSDLTKAGFIVGTPRYMAPEYLKGEELGPAADIYSLGLLGYELLVGKKAIEGETSMTIIARQVSEDEVHLPAALDVPGQLRKVIDTMTAKNIDKRYANAEAVLDELEHWDQAIESESIPMLELDDVEVQPDSISAPTATPTAGVPAAQPTVGAAMVTDDETQSVRGSGGRRGGRATPEANDQPTNQSKNPSGGNRAILAILAVLLVAGLGAGAWYLWSPEEASMADSESLDSAKNNSPMVPVAGAEPEGGDFGRSGRPEAGVDRKEPSEQDGALADDHAAGVDEALDNAGIEQVPAVEVETANDGPANDGPANEVGRPDSPPTPNQSAGHEPAPTRPAPAPTRPAPAPKPARSKTTSSAKDDADKPADDHASSADESDDSVGFPALDL